MKRFEPFCLLRDAKTYVSSPHDLRVDDEDRVYWMMFFKRHLETVLKLAIEAGLGRDQAMEDLERRAGACRVEFNAIADDFLQHPRAQEKIITIMTLDRWRDSILRKHRFVDAFIDVKNRENGKMLPLLPAVCAELDSMRGPVQLRAVIEGVFAGNIFDLGAEATAKRFLGHSPDFFNTRAGLSPRPWRVDDYDQLEAALLNKHYQKCVFFIDNADSDFLLGALPMIRWLGQRGTRVVIAANERPSLNDMTIEDVRTWWPEILGVVPSLTSLQIDLVSTGTGEPMIDLAEISPELNQVSRDADLLILEGMGRGVETNLNAEFTCDALNIAMIKDARVAHHLGGKLFDLVCRFR